MSTDFHSDKLNYRWQLTGADVERITSAQKDFSIHLTKAGRKKVCLVYTNQKWYAIQPFCPHAGGPFANGWCENKNITCPYHRYMFDLESGRCVQGEPFYIKTYPVVIKSKNLYIGFKLSRLRSWLNRWIPNKDKNNILPFN